MLCLENGKVPVILGQISIYLTDRTPFDGTPYPER